MMEVPGKIYRVNNRGCKTKPGVTSCLTFKIFQVELSVGTKKIAWTYR